MRLLLASLLAVVAGVGAAVVVSGCGDDSKLIPVRDAKALDRYADRVGAAVSAERCVAAEQLVVAAQDRINELPRSVDRDLRTNLHEGFRNLGVQAARECAGTVDTTTIDTTPTQTIPTQTTTTAPTTTTETTTTETTTTETTTTSEPPPTENDGGSSAP